MYTYDAHEIGLLKGIMILRRNLLQKSLTLERMKSLPSIVKKTMLLIKVKLTSITSLILPVIMETPHSLLYAN
jgi:hypothetical protein